ncbi:MAG: response regulator transcription factor, partial [Clostridia bacterium]
HEVVRIGLKSLLARVEDLEVVAEAGSAEEAIRTIDQLAGEGRAPDVVVMDVRMPGGSGVDACRQIRAKHPDVKVIMLTSYTDDEAIFASVMAGASGYVLKQVGSEDLIKAIRTVHAGGSLLDPSTTQRVLERMRMRDPLNDLPEPLTDQERRLLSLIAEGKTNKEIAAIVYLSEKTVRNYVSNILAKLGLSNRAEAAAFAVRHGLAGGPDNEKRGGDSFK